MATTLKYMKMARSCKELFERVDAEYRKEFPSVGNSRVTNSVLFGYAYDKIAGLIRIIDWAEVSRSWAFSPDSNCPDVRFTSSLSLPTSLYPRVTWEALEEFRAYCKEIFSGIRRNVYLPFCVRLILAAFILSVKGELPFMVAGGDDLPEDAPAVFDPEELLYPNGTNSPEALGDVLDPGIFDRVRAEADAAYKETGVF